MLIICFYFLYDVLFAELSEQTAEQADDTNIRFLAAAYFLQDILKSPYTLLFGYGDAGQTGAFYNYQENLNTMYGFFIADVGFIGKIWQYGLLYVIMCYYLLYIVFFKYKHKISTYLRLFVLFATIMSPMIFPISGSAYILIWSMLLYVCELHITNSPYIIKHSTNNVRKYTKK